MTGTIPAFLLYICKECNQRLIIMNRMADNHEPIGR